MLRSDALSSSVMMMIALRAFAGHDGGRTARSCDSCLSVHNRCCPKRALRYYISFSAGCIQPDAGSGAADGGQMGVVRSSMDIVSVGKVLSPPLSYMARRWRSCLYLFQ